MSERDTPYDVVFRRGRIDFEGARFEDVRAEVESRGMTVDDPERFIMLGTVGALLREMILDEEASDDAGDLWQAIPAAAIAQTGALLYHAYRFREAGSPVHTVDEPTLRALLTEQSPVNGGAVPNGAAVLNGSAAQLNDAGYVQLPHNLVWARADEDGPAEPLDGFFFARGQRMELLFALGVRPRRPGFTAIPIGIDGPELDGFAATKARYDGVDFANILPGGEIDRLHGLTSAGEALRLAALCMRWLEGR